MDTSIQTTTATGPGALDGAAPSPAPPFAEGASSARMIVTTLSLLAMAKDARYIQECQQLLQPILQSLWRIMLIVVGGTTTTIVGGTTTTNSRQDDTEDYHDLTTALAASASSLLYAVTVIRRLRRTAGMEVVGLEYMDPSKNRRKIVWGAALSALGVGVLQVFLTARRRSSRILRTSSSEPTVNQERLTGVARRQIFEQQRQAMLRRAETAHTEADAANQNLNSQTPATSVFQAAKTTTTIGSKFSGSLLWSRMMDALADSWATASINGPHEIVQPNGTTTTQSNSVVVPVLQWILRLHLALFCCNGRFPTVWHRLLWNQTPLQVSDHQPQIENCYSSTVPRVVGLLIAAQAAGTALQALSRHWVHRWVDASLRHVSQEQQQRPRSSIHFDADSSTATTASPSKYPSQQQRHAATCAICRQPRRFPACSIHCGHVFCWNCWQQWIGTTVPACPLCRRPCRANEVMLLQNYITNHADNDEDD